MKKVKLEKLSLQNFKGINSFTFSPAGQDATLYANNGVGKSTCSDAYAWLLTDSDSQDNGKFQIKKFDENSNIVKNVIHSVEGVFNVDGEELSLKKEYREVFSGKGIDKVFDGNKTLRFINELSVSKQKYQSKLEELAPKDIFKSLLNPAYFSSQKTEIKRNLILGLIGDVTQDDVIASDKKLAALPDIIKKLSVEEYKDVAQKQKTKLKKQRDEIPIRIDEILLNQPGETDLKKVDVEKNIRIWEEQKASAEKEKFQIENGGDVAMREQELAKIRAQKLNFESVFADAKNKGKFHETDKMNDIILDVERLEGEMVNCFVLIKTNNDILAGIDKEITNLREDWQTEKKIEYDIPPEVCFECGQKIPEDQYKAAQKKGLEKFNTTKALLLRTITEKGKKLAEEKGKIEKTLWQTQENIQAKSKEIKNKKEDITAIDKVIQTFTNQKLETEEYKNTLKLEADCTKKIEASKTGDTADQALVLASKIESFGKNISGLLNTLNKIKKIDEDKARIAELSKEQKKLAKEFETLEKNIALVDLYMKKWVLMVEGPVNDLFEITKFQMFGEQVNGGIKDTCVAVNNGVPYDISLNKGHKKMVGLDIIKTFSRHYGISLPLFIDDAEGVTTVPDMDAQIIRLIKPEINQRNKEYYSKLQPKPFKED